MNVNAEKPYIRLRVLMICDGLETVDLVKHAGLSLSLAKKLMCGQIEPSQKTIDRIESFFGQRIFSSPAQWRARRRLDKKSAGKNN